MPELTYALLSHWWRGQIVIRFGPSSRHYDLWLQYPDGKTEAFVLADDPRQGPTLAYLDPSHPREVIGADGRRVDVFRLRGRLALKPRTPANPTKETPSFLEALETGKAEWLETGPTFRKLRLGNRALAFLREEPGAPFWEVRESPGPTLEKVRAPFGSHGGKRFLARKLTELIPEHRVYVEPFAGAAAVFFRKEPSPVEVLNDRSERIVWLLRYLRDAPEEELRDLGRRDYSANRERYLRFLREVDKAKGKERAYRIFYLFRHSFHRSSAQEPGGFAASDRDRDVRVGPEDFLRWKERLNGTRIYQMDGRKLIRKLDRPDVFFFIDPPYLGKGSGFAHAYRLEDWLGLLKDLEGLRGKFLLTMNPETYRQLVAAGWRLPRGWKAFRRQYSAMGRHHEPGKADWILANFAPKPVEKGSVEILKADEEKRLVYGVVLKPDVPDAHGDVIRAEEIEETAHRFLIESRRFDWMHQKVLPADDVKVVQSYIAPVTFAVNGRIVPKGSWVLVAKVLNDALWKEVKQGSVRAFSIRAIGLRRRLGDVAVAA